MEPAAVGGGKLCPHPYTSFRYTRALLQFTSTSLPSQSPGLSALHRGSREGALALGFIGIVGKIRPPFRLKSTTTAQLLHSTLWCFSNRNAFFMRSYPETHFGDPP